MALDAHDPDAVREGFREVFDQNYTRVLAYALRRVSSRAEAEDVAAETFAVAWRRREELPELVTPWLYGVAAHVVRNQRRGERRRLRLRRRIEAEPVRLGPDPSDSLAERDELAGAFAGLTERQREVLRLVSWEGLSQEEAAVALGCSHSALRVRLHRARAALAKQLDAGGHEAEAGRQPRPAPQETE